LYLGDFLKNELSGHSAFVLSTVVMLMVLNLELCSISS